MTTAVQRQLYFDEVTIGSSIPVLSKSITTRQLVKWAGASRDFYEIHYDKDVALGNGLQGVIVHGRLKAAFLGQMLSNWVGPAGTIKKLGCQYRGTDLVGTLTCGGKVTRVAEEGGEHLVECEIWIRNEKDETTTTGTATVSLPARIL